MERPRQPTGPRPIEEQERALREMKAQLRDRTAKEIARGLARIQGYPWAEGIDWTRPQSIREGEWAKDGSERSVVEAAAIGSLFIRENGYVDIKLDTGWSELTKVCKQIATGAIDVASLSDDVIGGLEQAADLQTMMFAEALSRVRNRVMH